jgi:hypothetical protein
MDASASSGSPGVETFRVNRDRILMVEGRFDAGFIRALLARNDRRHVQVEQLDGEGGVRAKVLARALTAGFESVKWLGIMLDADSNADGQYRSARDAIVAISKPRFAAPESGWSRRPAQRDQHSSSVIVFPDGATNGDLETFLRSVLQNQPIAECVDRFVDCVKAAGTVLRHESKTWVYSYLATLAQPGPTLSAAARAGELPVDHEGFASLLALIPRDDETL